MTQSAATKHSQLAILGFLNLLGILFSAIPSTTSADPFDPALPRYSVEDIPGFDPKFRGTVIVRGRVLGVTTDRGTSSYLLWLTSMGDDPSVMVSVDATTIPLPEDVKKWIGQEIEVSSEINRQQKDGDKVEISLMRHARGHEPRLAAEQSAKAPQDPVNPTAIFSSMPRLSVEDVQKVDPFSDPNKVFVVGKLDSVIRNSGMATFWITPRGHNKPSVSCLSFSSVFGSSFGSTVSPTSKEIDEIEKLVGKEVAIIGELGLRTNSFDDADIDDVLIVVESCILDNGHVRPAVFLASEIPENAAPHARTTATTPASKPTPQVAPTTVSQTETTSGNESEETSQTLATKGILLAPMQVELKHNGQVVGSTTVPPGTSAPIVRWVGQRAMIKYGGGESWAETASEWEISPISDLHDYLPEDQGVKVSITLVDGEPRIAWITPTGLFYAERNGVSWEIEKVDTLDFEQKYLGPQ